MTIKDHEFMFEAIEKVRKANEARRTIKEQILSDMGLASEQQLSLEKRRLLEERIDAILAGKDREYMLTEDSNLQEVSSSLARRAQEKAEKHRQDAERMIGRGPNDEKSGVEKRAERQVSKFRRYADTKGWKERENRYKQQMKIREEDYMDEEDYDLQEVSLEKATQTYVTRRAKMRDSEKKAASQAVRGKVPDADLENWSKNARKAQNTLDRISRKHGTGKAENAVEAGRSARAKGVRYPVGK